MESPLFSPLDRECPSSPLRPARLRLTAIFALLLGTLILSPSTP